MSGLKNPGPCTIDGCSNLEKAKGLCAKHYERVRIHGSAHTVLKVYPPTGAIDAYLAALPSDGEGCITWPFSRNNQGYGYMALKGDRRGKRIVVSRYICERRHGPAPTPEHQAAHSCGKGHEGCIAPWHLAWKTPLENSADLDVHGTRLRGDECPYAKLTSDDVRTIRSLAGVVSQKAIGERFGISQTGAGKIIRRQIWSHLP